MQEAALTPNEARLIHLVRMVGYGTLNVEVKDGQPYSWEITLANRFDKPAWPGQAELLQQNTTP